MIYSFQVFQIAHSRAVDRLEEKIVTFHKRQLSKKTFMENLRDKMERFKFRINSGLNALLRVSDDELRQLIQED